MGSNSKKHKESRKRRHRSPNDEYENQPKEKKRRHHHKKHKKREKKYEYVSDDSDIIEVIPIKDPSPTPVQVPRREKEREPVVETNKSSDSLSIEETNKLRAKLGLKPLDVARSEPNAASASGKSQDDNKKKDDWGEFYHKPAENLAHKAQQEKIRAKLVEHKERRELQNKMGRVKLLGESDEEEDAEAWIRKSRKIESDKEVAERRAKMLEELDEQFGIGDIIEANQRKKMSEKYTAQQLQGLRVNHSLNSFAEERNVILTLKDKGVLDDGEDELMNVNMHEDEKYKKSNENKKKKVLYNAYEDEEFDEYGIPKEKSLLSKYDEEIHGENKETFKIGVDSVSEKIQAYTESIKEKLAKKRLESINDTRLKLASEYYNEEEMAKFKKPKKKIRKIRPKGKLLSVEDLEVKNVYTGIEDVGSRRPKYKMDPAAFDIDDVPVPDAPSLNDLKLEDDKDDVLEKALQKARKIRQKENVVADLVNATNIKTEIKEENVEGNIILNATAEFCRTLGDIPTYGKSGNRDETEELDIDFDKDPKPDEDDDDDVEIIEPTGWNCVDPTDRQQNAQNSQHEVQILDEEPDVSKGMGAALKVAMSKGYLDRETNNRPSNSRLAHLQAQHYSIEDKVYGDDGNERGNRRERYVGPLQDFKEKDGFKPNVKLEYIDDDGHVLNSKEAFRYLSHKFHGKGPGKNKVEKRIKKGVQEQLMKKMSSTDTPLGTLNMLQAKQKETQSPFVVLSGAKQAQSTVISKTAPRR